MSERQEFIFNTCTQVCSLARELMNQHGLGHWVFEFDGAKRRAGRCSYGRQTISLSRHFVAYNEINEVRDTILHEIAHALAFLRHDERGHGEVWKRVCVEIGAKPERCYDASQVNMPRGNYEATCPNCKQFFKKFRLRAKPDAYNCGKCGRENGKLYFKRVM